MKTSLHTCILPFLTLSPCPSIITWTSLVRQTIFAKQTKGTLTLGNPYHALAWLTKPKVYFAGLLWALRTLLKHNTLSWPWHGWRGELWHSTVAHAGPQAWGCNVDMKYNHAITPPCMIKNSKNVFLKGVFMTKTTQNKPQKKLYSLCCPLFCCDQAMMW